MRRRLKKLLMRNQTTECLVFRFEPRLCRRNQASEGAVEAPSDL
jgi:hypothetical protein